MYQNLLNRLHTYSKPVMRLLSHYWGSNPSKYKKSDNGECKENDREDDTIFSLFYDKDNIIASREHCIEWDACHYKAQRQKHLQSFWQCL